MQTSQMSAIPFAVLECTSVTDLVAQQGMFISGTSGIRGIPQQSWLVVIAEQTEAVVLAFLIEG